MATTYEAIATVTVGSGGAATIDFTSIPATYTDLCLVSSVRTSRGAYHESLTMTFNGASTNRTNRRLYGDGATPNSTSDTLMYGSQASGSTATASTFGSSTIYIPNYTSSNNKSSSEEGVSENNATNAFAELNANLWSSTAVINQITLTPENSGTIQQYSTATLYGIKNS
jgi:hypothetical protein